MTTAAVRNLRLCDVCGELDDHPRHVHGVVDGGVPSQEFLAKLPDGVPVSALVELLDPTTVVRHINCCAENGCGACAETVSLTGDARGADLVAALESGINEHLSTGALPKTEA